MSFGKSPANQSPFAGSPQEESLGRINYEAFCQAMLEWLPSPPDFKTLSVEVQRGWIAGAKAIQNL
jgi:hypothetical protein